MELKINCQYLKGELEGRFSSNCNRMNLYPRMIVQVDIYC